MFQQEKRLQACLRKQRQRVHIEEVDSSSDEEESKDNVVSHGNKVSTGHPSGQCKYCLHCLYYHFNYKTFLSIFYM